MIVMELVVALCMRSLKYPLYKVGPFKNKFLWAAILASFGLQLVILYVPGLQPLFDVHQPELIDWAVAALSGAIVFATIEIGKIVALRIKH
jgi:Ca2+-transporting ATPase